jgi:excisionase family DNA binding protein
MPIRLNRKPATPSLEDITRLLPDESAAQASPEATSGSDPTAAGPSPSPPFLSLRQTADWLCVSLSTVKRLIAKGELTSVRVGARRKIPSSQLTAYVAKDILLPDQIKDKDHEQ